MGWLMLSPVSPHLDPQRIWAEPSFSWGSGPMQASTVEPPSTAEPPWTASGVPTTWGVAAAAHYLARSGWLGSFHSPGCSACAGNTPVNSRDGQCELEVAQRNAVGSASCVKKGIPTELFFTQL